MRLIYTDVSTAPIEGAVDYIEPPECPGSYTKPDSIAKWHAEDKPKLIQKAVDRAALDPDLCRITGIGIGYGQTVDAGHSIMLCHDEAEEKENLQQFADLIRQRNDAPPAVLCGFNSLKFDWPVLMRRARYLGVKLTINLDRYRSGHLDLSELISNRGQLPIKSLGWYVKRLRWDDLCKPLEGAEEARVFKTGRWDELSASLAHDIEATRRLHQWWEQR